jgi:hypothetical protein
MQPSELRINNIINGIYHNFSDEDEDIELETICKVITLDETGSLDYPIYVESDEDIEQFSQFQGIPLTEEWLNKSDLEKIDHVNMWQKGNFAIWYQKGHDAYGQLCHGYFYFVTLDLAKTKVITPFRIKYVHQLQNLYFSLVGEELTLK